ncbi:MAG TPA: DUF5005 domain-containing protein [Trueperaceae bacterium]
MLRKLVMLALALGACARAADGCTLLGDSIEEASAVVDAEFNARFTREGPGWTGGDGTYSVRLPDGRTLWLFSDTFLGRVNPDGTRPPSSPLIHNSLVVQDGDTLTTLRGGSGDQPDSFFADPEWDQWYWLYDATVEQSADGAVLRVFLLRFVHRGSGVFGFAWVGTDLATLSLPDLRVVDIQPVPADDGVAWGAALLEGPDYTYIYGTEDLGADKYAHLARAPKGGILGSWEYYAGPGEDPWKDDPGASVRLLHGVANEYSVTPVNDGYLMITMDTRQASSPDILAYESCQPEGPWRHAGVIYRAPEVGGNLFAYNAHAHPEFDGDGLLISYNVNSREFWDLLNDASIYRPRFIRLPLPIPEGAPRQP